MTAEWFYYDGVGKVALPPSPPHLNVKTVIQSEAKNLDYFGRLVVMQLPEYKCAVCMFVVHYYYGVVV
jgi:hypothetical protein